MDIWNTNMEYRYGYMDSWNEFNEPLLPNKKIAIAIQI